MMERDMIEIGQRLGSRMIADDRNDVARQFAGAVPVQQVGKTVVIIGNQNGDSSLDKNKSRPLSRWSSLCKTLPLCAIRNWEIAATTPLRASGMGVLRSKTAVFIFRLPYSAGPWMR